MPAQRGPKRIGILGYDGVAAIDLTGVLEAFTIADGAPWRSVPQRYRMSIVGLRPEAFQTESGIRIHPDATVDDKTGYDTIIVPGGAGLREAATNAQVATWLKKQGPAARRVVAICTGLYALAASGLVDGRRATTHWRHAADIARLFPAVRIEPDAIFIKDGKYYSSAGMTAGIDLAMALIEEDCGPAVAIGVARQLVVYMRRSGGQLQYSEPLRFQARSGDRFADLAAALVNDLAGDWTVARMADQVGLSPRQFTRRFREAFSEAPATYLERLRLDEGRDRLLSSADGIARIAASVGFESDDGFRRAFERRFGVTPGSYRARFITEGPNPWATQ